MITHMRYFDTLASRDLLDHTIDPFSNGITAPTYLLKVCDGLSDPPLQLCVNVNISITKISKYFF